MITYFICGFITIVAYSISEDKQEDGSGLSPENIGYYLCLILLWPIAIGILIGEIHKKLHK